MNRFSRPFILALLAAALVRGAEAEDTTNRPEDESKKWNLTVSAVASNAAIKIVDSEIDLPDDFAEGDFEASLSDDLSVSSTIVSGSVGYRILPFAEVFGRAGLISSDTETGIVITGTPGGPFADVFNGPITIDQDTNLEVEGYSLGLGANAVLPVTTFGEDMLAAYSSFQYVWNQLDDTVSSEGATTSFGLIYPVNRDHQKTIYRLGGSYNWISRDIERDLVLNGETLRVLVTQEFEDPWAVEAGVGIPITENTLLAFGAWHQLSGETSVLASLTYRFGTGN